MMLLIFMYLQKNPTQLYIELLKWWNKPTRPQLSWKSYLNKKVIDIKENKIITYNYCEIWWRNCNGEIDVMKKKNKITYDFVLEDKPFRREGVSKEGRDRKDWPGCWSVCYQRPFGQQRSIVVIVIIVIFLFLSLFILLLVSPLEHNRRKSLSPPWAPSLLPDQRSQPVENGISNYAMISGWKKDYDSDTKGRALPVIEILFTKTKVFLWSKTLF